VFEQRPDGASQTIADSPARSRLAVTRLVLTNFRSYAQGEIGVSGRSVVLAGPNGAGKTNLLDAISLLSPGRGLRGSKLGDHTRKGPIAQGEALWGVAATVARGDEAYEIGTGLMPDERRQTRMNGASAESAGALGDVVQMSWLTPAMDRLFIESASGRRRFLDRLVFGFDSAHASRASRYETAMRERARLLKFGPRDPTWLDALENQMAEAGVAIAIARAETVARLNIALAERGDAGAFPCAQLAMDGETDLLLAEHGEATTAAMRERLAAARVRDAQAGRTSFGPHLSDLAVRHTRKCADARECSTGEQKALLISIVLADAWELARVRGGHAPILLLDEIAAHLDARRRAALFDEITALGAQAWMTGTDIEIFSPLRSRADLFAVADSQFTLISG
jgi:DNA replication and repair protein RecF